MSVGIPNMTVIHPTRTFNSAPELTAAPVIFLLPQEIQIPDGGLAGAEGYFDFASDAGGLTGK
jgi:hypothetical protein